MESRQNVQKRKSDMVIQPGVQGLHVESRFSPGSVQVAPKNCDLLGISMDSRE